MQPFLRRHQPVAPKERRQRCQRLTRIRQINLLIIRDRLEQKQRAQIFHQLCQHLACILALLQKLAQLAQRRRQILPANGLSQRTQHLSAHNAQNLAHRRRSNLLAHNAALIQKAQRITQTALRLNRNQAQRLRISLQAAALCHHRQMLSNLIHRHAAELKALAARMNRRRDFLRIRRRQNKNSVRRRLLQRFQQRIECRRRQHMHLVDDIHLITALDRRKRNLLLQLLDLVNTAVGRSVNLQNIHRGAGGNPLAIMTMTAGLGRRPLLTVQRLCQNTRCTCLACAARTAEQIGMRNPAAVQSILQRCLDCLLTDKGVKILRPPLTVQS